MAFVAECRKLTKTYGHVVGVKDLELQVPQGTIFGFLGPNGAGKTTTIRILTGFLRPTSGKALVFGLDAWQEKVRIKADLGFVPDLPGLYNNLSGRGFLDYMQRLQGKPAILQKDLLERLEVGRNILDRAIKGYSRGMRQKIALVQALQHDPQLVVMDEPSEGLDPLMQKELFEILRECQGRGRTIFMSSHILPEVERWCQQVAIVRQGSVVAVEDVANLRLKKVRTMEVVLARDGTALDLNLPCVLAVQRNGRTLYLKVQGDINPLLRRLAEVDVEDMVFETARLEDVFMQYYGANEGAKA